MEAQRHQHATIAAQRESSVAEIDDGRKRNDEPSSCRDHLSDQALIDEVKAAAVRERVATVRLIALLAELDARRLYLGEGCSSLFTYCTQVLRLSEHAASGRIEAARIARKFPVVLDLLAEGAVTLTTLTLLGPQLTPANHQQVLTEARHRSKREVEQLVARLRPLPPVPKSVRKLPTSKAASGMDLLADATSEVQRAAAPVATPSSAPPQQVVLTPLAPDRYKVQLTVTRATHDKLRRAQDLLRHSIPTGDLAEIVDRAVTVLLADHERAKLAAVEHPRAARSCAVGARYIPSAVRRAVWRRDGAQCAFVGAEGRCTERGFLEFHHIRPHAVGGATTVENLELRCRAHNLHEAEHYFIGRLPLLREARAEYDFTPSSTCSMASTIQGSRAASDVSRARQCFLTRSVRTEYGASDRVGSLGIGLYPPNLLLEGTSGTKGAVRGHPRAALCGSPIPLAVQLPEDY